MISFYNSKSFNFVNPNDSTSFDVGSGDNRYLFIVANTTITQITYAGVNMSKLYTFTDPISDGNGNNVVVWGLANPASGTNTVQLDNGMGVNGTIGIASYDGVYGGVQPEGTVITNFSNDGIHNTQVANLSSTVTTISSGAWAIMFTRGSNNAQNFVAGIGTLRTSGFNILGDGTQAIIDSGGAVSPVGNQTLRADWASGTGYMSNVIMAISPFVAPNFKPQMIIL